jgi:hypothetical protein
LLVNIGAQILVAALSLFWPVDPSIPQVLLTTGDVTVANLTQWRVNPSNASDAAQLSAANAFDVETQDYSVLPVGPLNNSSTQGSGPTIFQSNDHWEYQFLNSNPKHLHSDVLVSTRTVRASYLLCQRGSLIMADTM